MGFCYQKNTKDPSVARCGSKDFWKMIRLSSTPWIIDTRRAILQAVEEKDEAMMQQWLKHTDFRKFDLRTLRDLKTKNGKEKWKKKSATKKLLAWADDLKKTLPVFTFSCREFDLVKRKKKLRDGRQVEVMERPRQLAYCHLNGLVMLDIDHVDNPLEVWQRLQQNEELMKRVVLVHITSSGRGLRIIFTANSSDGNLADNIIVFADALGCKADSSCIDATRNSFAPKEDEILFIDEERLFNYYDEAFDREYTPMYREKKTQPIHHQFEAPSNLPQKGEAKAPSNQAESKHPLYLEGVGGRLSFKGTPYSSIIDAWWQLQGGEPQEGERNVKLYQLAVNLRAICDNSPQLLMQIMPSLGLDEQEMRSIVESACKEPPKGISKAMREAIARAKAIDSAASSNQTPPPSEGLGEAQDDIDRWLWQWGAQIEALFDDYPLLRDVCKGLKPNQYPAALFVAGGLMMTLMTRCTYRFYHRPEELRRLNNSTLIIGDPASGKSFATRLYKLLAAPIIEADKVGRDAINAYRELMRTKGANKEKPKKPKVVVRIHPARTSNAQFIQDMVNSVEEVDGQLMQLHMLTFDTELDNTLALQKGGAYIDKQALELKAFHNEEDGQAYSNNDSILQNFFVIWNFIYTGTPLALKKKVNEQNFGSGLATRLTCIPLPATNFEMMARESSIDLESDERLKAWACRLDRMKGELTVRKLVDELYDWTARRMADAAENNSKAEEMLLKRCAYHGLNFAAPFIVMRHWDQIHQDGQYWCGTFETDAVDWRLCELLCNIQYACQRYYFGAMAEAYFDNQLKERVSSVTHRQKTVEGFNRLPEVFTMEDVVRVFGGKVESANMKVNRLMKDGLVEKVGSFTENGKAKAKYRKSGNVI